LFTYWEVGVGDGTADGSWVGLPEAIESLRADLAQAWWDGQQQRLRFRVEPVELTVQVGLTHTIKGTGGVKWYVLTIGGEKTRETVTTQTLKLRLTPIIFDEDENGPPGVELLVSDLNDENGAADNPAHEPE
jgi:hypothetical protein